jgi:hypothetical protein
MYEMKKERRSNYLGPGANKWRTKVAAEYWRPSSKPQNVVNLVTAILGGHKPQYKALTPGVPKSFVQSRAEKFIHGVIDLNSQRTGEDLYRKMIFRSALDGQVGVRVIWHPDAPEADITTTDHPDGVEGEQVTLGVYDHYQFPIDIDIIPIDQLYYEGRGPWGLPYRYLYHAQKLTTNEMLSIWGGVEEASAALKKMQEEQADKTHKGNQKYDLIEYWEYNEKNEVVHAVVWKKRYIIEPHVVTSYKYIPYVIAKFQAYDAGESELPAIPFLYPILHDVSNSEYITSRMYRLVDMLSGIPPIKRGGHKNVNINGTWGKVQNLQEGEDIVFPKAPGFGPDIYQVLDDLKKSMSEGTFSEATFGTVSGGVSGYGLSQMLGADTTRTNTPKANMELALGQIVTLILSLLQTVSPHFYLSVLTEDKGTATSAMLLGEETFGMQVQVKMRLMSTQDELRRASIGAQISSMPDLPVSHRWILENYFDIHQPEEEMEMKRIETAQNSPVIQMMAMLQALAESDHPMKHIMIAELQKQLQGALGGGPQAAGPQPSTALPQMGGGIPQAASGTDNLPMDPTMNPTAPQQEPGASVGGLQPMTPPGS